MKLMVNDSLFQFFPSNAKATNQFLKLMTRTGKVDSFVIGKDHNPDFAVLGPLLDSEPLPDLIGWVCVTFSFHVTTWQNCRLSFRNLPHNQLANQSTNHQPNKRTIS